MMAKIILTVLCAIYTASAVSGQALKLPLDTLSLPPGFKVQLFYNGSVPAARQLAVSESDSHRIVYVGTDESPGQVFALIDRNKTGQAAERVTVLSSRNSPNGVAFLNGSLWVAELNKITRYDNADSYVLQRKAFPAGALVNDQFPNESHHGLKYIRFGPDGKLYAPLGGPFNIGECEPYGDIAYCTINRLNADGTDLETVATGVRNSVGYDWHPQSGLLAFTDNGRDMLGDDRPDDELNVVEEVSQNFGFPYCQTQGFGNPYQRNAAQADFIVDPDETRPGYNASNSYRACEEFATLPAQPLGPHVAALGMKFYTGSMFPAAYRNTAFIALHGSWNRQPQSGHAVMNAKVLPNGTVTAYTSFATGWLENANASDASSWGRPVDVVQLSDGSLLVSGDSEGAIYRFTYQAPAQPTSIAG
ncbi:hypothetical protein WJX72_003952 [[Myrmecia] bisecta]|uniref:Pyrroloquinoline quinone-dependent pyranose dehydrogenase beta-propeller domain-containing protein n=1 Tax=[Myrmecia] bisecta TaxID=41462 RepID=A0AAW1PP69_9CHLO